MLENSLILIVAIAIPKMLTSSLTWQSISQSFSSLSPLLSTCYLMSPGGNQGQPLWSYLYLLLTKPKTNPFYPALEDLGVWTSLSRHTESLFGGGGGGCSYHIRKYSFGNYTPPPFPSYGQLENVVVFFFRQSPVFMTFHGQLFIL